MKYTGIADLPASVSHLSLVQKSKVLNTANGLIDSGLSPEAAVEQASKDVLKMKTFTQISKSKETEVVKSDGEQMISYEVIYEPDTVDAHGEWVSAETLVKARDNFEKARAAGAVSENLFHLYETDSFTIEKTWIQEELDVVVIGSEQVIKAGTWVAKVKYNDPALWDLKKSGIVGGLSIQCSGGLIEATGELVDLNFGVELVEDDE